MADEFGVDAPIDNGGGADITPEAGGEATGSGAWPADVQAEYTKKTQALADERKNWDSQRAQQQQQLQQYAQQIQQQGYAQQQQWQKAQQQPQQQGQASMLDQLRQMPYLDGATAAQLTERILNEGINPLQSQLKQRDQALAQMHKDYTTLRNQVGASQGKQAERDLDARFVQLRDQHGLPDEEVINELLKDIYYSHEGDDLNTAYPDMAGNRINGLRKAFREMDRQEALKAKQQSPFPGKGGEMSPTSGKTGGYKTPQERTDELWPMLNPGQNS